MVTVTAFVAPENSAPQSVSGFCIRRQMFVGANNAAWRPFEMEPGEVSRKSAHERLEKSETHHEQARRHGIELRFDVRADHVGKRHGQSAAEHQIRNNA